MRPPQTMRERKTSRMVRIWVSACQGRWGRRQGRWGPDGWGLKGAGLKGEGPKGGGPKGWVPQRVEAHNVAPLSFARSIFFFLSRGGREGREGGRRSSRGIVCVRAAPAAHRPPGLTQMRTSLKTRSRWFQDVWVPPVCRSSRQSDS